MSEPPRYPGYDVLAKRDGVSWNDATRRTIDARLATPSEPQFFSADEWPTVCAVCDCIVPQPAGRPGVPLAALLDARLLSGRTDGYRRAELPQQDVAWRCGLAALDADARLAHAKAFHELPSSARDALLVRMQRGELGGPHWQQMPSKAFFEHRLLPDIVCLYYSHPITWNEIGFGGPASPRGYVRMGFDRRDPWEAAAAGDNDTDRARRDNQRVR